MRVIKRRTLREFWAHEREAEQPLRAWYQAVEDASWSSPAEVKAQFASASILQKGRVVFNIGGNKFRLIVEINYKKHLVFVRFVGTHVEYDDVDAQAVKLQKKKVETT